MRNKINLPKMWLCTCCPRILLLLKTHQEHSITHVTKTSIPWPWSLTCIRLGCRASSLPSSSSTVRQFDPPDHYRPCPFLHLHLRSGCVLSLGCPPLPHRLASSQELPLPSRLHPSLLESSLLYNLFFYVSPRGDFARSCTFVLFSWVRFYFPSILEPVRIPYCISVFRRAPSTHRHLLCFVFLPG